MQIIQYMMLSIINIISLLYHYLLLPHFHGQAWYSFIDSITPGGSSQLKGSLLLHARMETTKGEFPGPTHGGWAPWQFCWCPLWDGYQTPETNSKFAPEKWCLEKNDSGFRLIFRCYVVFRDGYVMLSDPFKDG